jgi:hypothetical protein
MPPHCDSLDGPVVAAARQALVAGDVDVILPYVPADGEEEIRAAFARVFPLCTDRGEAAAVAQQWFFETVVRIHRAGEHAPYTGLKPAGLDVGPAIPLAERDMESGDVADVHRLRAVDMRHEVAGRQVMRQLVNRGGYSVAGRRECVHAMLGLQVYGSRVYQCLRTDRMASSSTVNLAIRPLAVGGSARRP